MSLTHQPFAELPSVDQLGGELQSRVQHGEKVLLGAMGSGFLLAALIRPGISRLILTLIGGMALWKATSQQSSQRPGAPRARSQEGADQSESSGSSAEQGASSEAAPVHV